MEKAVVALRGIQYVAAFIVAGGALFAVYALPARGEASAAGLGWPRSLLATASGVLLVAAVLGLIAQTAVVAGSLGAALDPATMSSVMTEMAMGAASAVRAGAAALALGLLLITRPGRPAWLGAVGLGAVSVASLAWMGHGAATEGGPGLIHLLADIAHLAAAAIWLGALAFFVGLALSPASDQQRGAFQTALAGFSGVGSCLVAVLVATGLINSWFLIGPVGLTAVGATLYGRLLLAKLAAFGVMLALAAINRFRLAPALAQARRDGGGADKAVSALKRSLILETGMAVLVALLVAWLGRLAPIAAS